MAIKKARTLGLLAYDLTSSSVKGVEQFKMGFRPQCVHLLAPRYYVLSNWRYACFANVYGFLRNHKMAVAGVLKFVHRLKLK